MRHLRWKLLLAMLAVVVVTVSISALFTRRVAHGEMRKLMVTKRAGTSADVGALAEFHRTHEGWNGVRVVLDQAGRPVVLADAQSQVIATSSDLARSKVKVTDGVLVIEERGSRLIARLPPQPVSGRDGVVAFAFVLPERPDVKRPEMAALDRRLLVPFAAAALVAVLLTFILSSRITRPVERLTAAVDVMASGARPSPVHVSGRDEIAQLASSFNAMSAAIAKQDELRRRMVGDVAHELRTPLTNLRCELEAIQDGLTTVDPARIASLHEEVLHLTRLVDDLQDLAVAEAGGLTLQREEVDLLPSVQRIIGALAAEAERRGIAVTAEGENAVVMGDRTRLAQILRNLLTNALQHTPEGGRVAVAIARNGDEAVVAVEDTGPGIPDQECERVFERFYRVDESRNRESGGAGLGLAIVRQLVELHAGRAWAEKSDAGGARLVFTLPLRR